MSLTLAAAHYRYAAARTADVRDLLGYTATQHAVVVHSLLERADVQAVRPAEVRRLKALAEKRGEARCGSAGWPVSSPVAHTNG